MNPFELRTLRNISGKDSGIRIQPTLTVPNERYDDKIIVLLHNGGFCNNSKTVLAHIGAFPNKCTIIDPFHTTAT
jgi:hypothetical protein